MNSNCTPAPQNKKEIITDVGKILVAEHGKQKYYKSEEVKKASKKSKYYDAMHCWAMCIFSSHSDFDSCHQARRKVCDYVAMKTEMLDGLTTSAANVDWLEIPNLDIDASWLDLGDIFGGILEGIGDF